MNRAFSAFEIKAVDTAARVIEGIASTPRPDRVGDVVVSEGAVYKLPLPLLLDHNHREAVGEVDFVEVSPKGIKFRAHIKTVEEPGEVKNLVDKAWSLAKNGLRKAVSIGFSPQPGGYEWLEDGGIKFNSWEWLELSMVTVPANADAAFQAKSLDADAEFQLIRSAFTAAKSEIPVDPESVAASGKSVRVVRLADPARVGAKPFVIRSIRKG